jgi:hypothetical protein
VRPARTDKTNITAYARPLIASALLASGLVQLAAPVFAQTVPQAGTGISNTATASYEDADGTSVNTTSNTVTVQVAKVAGIAVTGKGFVDDTTADAYKPNDVVYANFDVTNTGNDGVQFQVPKLASLTNEDKTTASDQATFNEVQYNSNITGTGAAVWVPVTATGGTTSPTIPVSGKLQVRVKFTINSTATATRGINVKLGQTTTPGAAHIQRGVGTGEDVVDNDIFTVDVATADGTVVKLAGAAANGIREASALQTITVQATKQAFPSITLTSGTPVPIGTGNTDTITYTAGVSVASTAPIGSGKVAADLTPTVIKLGTGASPVAGTDTPRVIVTTSIPAGSTYTSLGTVPTGWTPVYATTVYTAGSATTVVWSTTPPLDLADVKQVGFIYEPSGAPTTGAPLPKGTTVSLPINVTTTGLGTLNATASVTGTTPDAAGLADSAKPETAVASKTVTTDRTVADSVYNGPVSNAQAKGPGGSYETDFTNKSMAISGTANTTRDASGNLPTLTTTSAVTFSNAVKNPTNASTNIYLLPTAPTTTGDLPTSTTVKIKNSDGSEIRTYSYNGTKFTYVSSNTTTTTPIVLPSVAANGGTAGYSVEVTLPTGVAQLVGYPVPVTAFTGGTITNAMAELPVTAAASGGNPATVAPTAANTTIDRVYTGFIDLIKEVRALDSVGQQDDPSISYLSGTNASSLKVTPGKFIQYRIRAVNVSPVEDTTATGSVVLKANKVQIVEDGTAGANTWGINTTHETGTAKTRLGTSVLPTSTIEFKQGAAVTVDTDTTVTRYNATFTPTLIAPGETGSFTFIRKLNAPAP